MWVCMTGSPALNSRFTGTTFRCRFRAFAERDLLHQMSQMEENRVELGQQMAKCSNMYEDAKYKSSLLAMQLTDEVSEIRQMADAVRLQGFLTSTGDVDMARDSLYFARGEFEQQAQSLGEELAVMQEDLRRNWPSAMGTGPQNDPLQGLGHIGELQQLIRKHMDASQTVRTQAVELCHALEERFAARMDAWQTEFTTSSQGLHHSSGGWPSEEHLAFVRARAEAVVAVAGSSREAYVKRLAVLFPHRSHNELMEHDNWYLRRKLMLDRRKTIREAWLRERQQLLGTVREMLERSASLEATQARSAADILQREAAQQQLHKELEELHKQREAEAKIVAAERAEADQATAEEAARLEEQRRKEMDHKKMLIAQYREENAQREAEARRWQQQEEAEAAERAAEQAAVNQERVDYRAVLYDMKLEEKELRLQQQMEEDAEREQRLEALRSKVAVEAERDPERVLQPTASMCAEAAIDPITYGNGNGFSDVHLFKDQRFKVMTALAEKGLLQSKHAHAYTANMISSARPMRPTRADNLTTVQREHHLLPPRQ
mmetsp:Transcript_28972/g.81592  ORF Transcript_28972/g.81592 Transcript_28972/m.81592 type:complete len:548 (-) Transcript_28972:212-1855(-)